VVSSVVDDTSSAFSGLMSDVSIDFFLIALLQAWGVELVSVADDETVAASASEDVRVPRFNALFQAWGVEELSTWSSELALDTEVRLIAVDHCVGVADLSTSTESVLGVDTEDFFKALFHCWGVPEDSLGSVNLEGVLTEEGIFDDFDGTVPNSWGATTVLAGPAVVITFCARIAAVSFLFTSNNINNSY
jgi:hypothetical protein